MVTDVEKAKRVMKRRHLSRMERDRLHAPLFDRVGDVDRSATSLDISDIISKYINTDSTISG